MVFQNPLFLWCLAFVAIPVAIHLFDFRKIRKIEFSQLKRIESLKVRLSARRNVKKWLLLFTRVFMVLAVVLAFSGLKNSNGKLHMNGKNQLLVDNTYSLAENCSDSDCLELAKEYLKILFEDNFDSRIWLNGFFNSVSFSDRKAYIDFLDGMSVSKERFTIPRDAAMGFTVISDFQGSVIDAIDLGLNDSISFDLVPLNRSAINSVVVDKLSLVSTPVDMNGRRIEVVLKNYGMENIGSVLVRLLGDGKLLGSLVVDVEVEGAERINFEIGDYLATNFALSIENKGDFTKYHYFILPDRRPVSLSIVSEKTKNYLEAVFGNSSFFNVSRFSSKSLNFDEVYKSDALILSSLEKIPNWFDLGQINGDVIIIPGPQIDVSNYEDRLGIGIKNNIDTIKNNIESKSLKNPFFKGIFTEINDGMSLPWFTPKYLPQEGSPLLRGDESALTYFENSGLYFFSSPLSESYSSISDHSIFVPLMYRIAESSLGFNEALSFELSSEPIELKVNSLDEAIPMLINENGRFIPEITYNDSHLSLTLPYELNEPGIYHLVAGVDTLKSIALNIPKSELKLDYMTFEELKDYYRNEPKVRVFDTSSVANLREGLAVPNKETSLWKYALILALMFLLAETAIHRWIK